MTQSAVLDETSVKRPVRSRRELTDVVGSNSSTITSEMEETEAPKNYVQDGLLYVRISNPDGPRDYEVSNRIGNYVVFPVEEHKGRTYVVGDSWTKSFNSNETGALVAEVLDSGRAILKMGRFQYEDSLCEREIFGFGGPVYDNGEVIPLERSNTFEQDREALLRQVNNATMEKGYKAHLLEKAA